MFGMETELSIIGVASLAACLFGYAFETQLRLTFQMQQERCENLIAQSRADSRLNHVIKGLCGGANGLLLGLKSRLETGTDSDEHIPVASETIIDQVGAGV
jgi:hypothetical protein